MAGASALAGSGRTAKAYNIEDLRKMAKRRLPKVIFDYMDGGADDEATLRNNRTAFDKYSLVGRMLVDVSGLSTATTVLGDEMSLPVILSSTGANRLFHTDGELAAARAAAKAGTVFATASSAMTSLEDVAKATDGPNWFQLYVWRDRGVLHEHMRRCKESGYRTLILTVDCQTAGNRERDFYNGFSFPLKMTPRRMLDGILHPSWTWDYLFSPKYSFPNIEGSVIGEDEDMSEVIQWFGQQLDDSFTWDDAERLIAGWDGQMIIKGLSCAEDAKIAAEIGAAGVVVSNHGGRQLDQAPTPIDVLPDIVDAVGDRVEVLVDSGFRRGTDIIKALALGARAVLIGRPYLYGLAAGGEAGVARAIELLRAELERNMALMGLKSIADITPDCLHENR